VPAGHNVQLAAPAAEKVPIGQNEQFEPVEEKEPRGQPVDKEASQTADKRTANPLLSVLEEKLLQLAKEELTNELPPPPGNPAPQQELYTPPPPP
jgi:hypothetical protein